MKKLTTGLTLAGLLGNVGFGLFAYNEYGGATKAEAVTAAEGEHLILPQAYGDLAMTSQAEYGLREFAQSAPALNAPQPKPITSIDQLAGDWLQTYSSLLSTGHDGGCAASIRKVEGTDSIVISNIWTTSDPSLEVKAKVDITTGKITIPAQYLYDHPTYGAMDFCSITSAGKPDRKTPVEGFFGDDGNIYLTTWWTVAINTGADKDKYVTANYNTMFERSNSTMSYTVETTDAEGKKGERTTTYAIKITQTSANVIKVKNFFNGGYPCELNLKRNRTAEIPAQIVYADPNGVWQTIGNLQFEDGKLKKYDNIIITEKAADDNNRTIVLKNWSLLTTGYFRGKILTATINSPVDISYPSLSVSEFEGEGTKANPYKIKKLDDLVLLSDKVNESTDYSWTTPPQTQKYARVFLGKYFSIENDIDMSGYRFDPIGNQWTNVFAGSVDGKNHVIRGLEISTGVKGFAGLFGVCDTTTVLSNIILESPNVETQGNYCGALVAWSRGTVENCHSRSPKVTNTYGNTAAGIVGIVENIKNCTVDNAMIDGYGGFVAGIAGQVNGKAENCHAYNSTVYASAAGTGSPAGGCFGSLYLSDAKNCSFGGTVNTAVRNAKMAAGLVAGTLYNGTMENCFGSGQVIVYSSEAIVGGVVGNLVGKMYNCYATGRVYGYSTRKSGGICGWIRPYTPSGAQPVASEVKNCFFAGTQTAETYLYDPEKEMRETLGTIDATTAPVIENVYFDTQLTDMKSVHNRASNADLLSAAGPKGFSSDVWTFTAGQYPRIKGLENNVNAQFASSAIELNSASTFKFLHRAAKLHPLGNTQYWLYNNGTLSKEGHFMKIQGNDLVLGEDFGTDTLFVVNGKAAAYHEIKVAPAFWDGDGSEASPYMLKTKNDLIRLANVTTLKKQYFSNVFFKFANDIDLELDPAFTGICSDTEDAHNKFDGIIDGDGYTIHRMYINSVVWQSGKSPEEDKDGLGTPVTGKNNNNPEAPYSMSYRGFVGRLGEGGVIRNLNIAADCQLQGWGTIGAFAGTLYGVIENCRNYADVTGYSCWVGGIAGTTEKVSTIRNCYNEGHIVSGYMNAGGIAGRISGVVENSMNAGRVEVKSISRFQLEGKDKLNDAGGIAGGSTGAIIRNCVNLGSVKATDKQAGGLVSRLTASSNAGTNDIYSSINYGTVEAGNLTLKGMISGETSTKGVIENVFYDGQIASFGPAQTQSFHGMYGVETARLTSGNAPKPEDEIKAEGGASTGFDTQIWQFDNGKYPVLKQFADEAAAKVLRSIIVNIPSGNDVTDLRVNATLSAPEGTVWKLEKGDVFKIQGNTLVAPATVDEMTYDVLTATCGNVSKSIAIQACPAIPLKGKGTAADPYIISTTDEWNAVADWMAKTTHDFKGEFVKVANDIDFTDKAFTCLADDGLTYFNGTLDGAGHTIKGISISATKTYVGAMGYIGQEAYVKNLTLRGKATTTKTHLGGFAAKIEGKVENCVNGIEITVTAKVNHIGGFCAHGGATAEFIGCVNEAPITVAGGNAGGFCGFNDAGSKFTKCENKGIVTATGTGSGYGGFVGMAYPADFTECVNSADIVATNIKSPSNMAGFTGYANAKSNDITYHFNKCENKGNITGKTAIGGIVGFVNKTANSTKYEMTDCFNYGDITTTMSGNPSGGIAVFYTPLSKFINCRNEGNVNNLGNVYAGGIAGYYSAIPTADTPVLFENCINNGEVNAEKNQAGGITASVYHFVTLKNCGNTGAINAPTMAGGICSGINSASGKLIGCWNTGSVTVKSSRAGGIAGYNSYQSEITDCWNAGFVTSTGTVQNTNTSTGSCQIGGIAGTSGAIMTNCYNVGQVKGLSQTGGLVGLPFKDKTQLNNCYQAGKIDAPADSCGHIIGITAINNGKNWTENNKAVNCWYVTDYITIDPAVRGEVGSGITLAKLAAKDMGEGWTSADDASLPYREIFATLPEAKFHSATVALAEGDTFGKVTKEFKVGTPSDVVWSSSTDAIAFDGTRAYFTKDYNGEAVLTAKSGEMVKTYTLNVDAPKSGIDGIGNDGKTVVSEIYYTPAGLRVDKPAEADGQLYIIVTVYDDGTTVTAKKVNK